MNANARAIPMPRVQGYDREVWVGALVLVGVLAVALTLFTVTSPSLFRGRTVIVAQVPDASGIRRGDPVRLRGVNIGRVKGFSIRGEGVGVDLELERGYSVPSDSTVRLRSSGLLGDMVAEVYPGTSPTPAGRGTVLEGGVTLGAFDAVDGIAKSAQKAMGRLEGLLDDRTVDNVQAGSQDFREAIAQLSGLASEQRAQMRDLTASLQRSAKGVEGVVGAPELQRSVRRLDALTQRLDTMAGSLERTARSAESVVTRLDQGQGSLGRLTRDDSLFNNVNSAAANLDRAAKELTALTADIRKDPKKYLKISIF